MPNSLAAQALRTLHTLRAALCAAAAAAGALCAALGSDLVALSPDGAARGAVWGSAFAGMGWALARVAFPLLAPAALHRRSRRLFLRLMQAPPSHRANLRTQLRLNDACRRALAEGF